MEGRAYPAESEIRDQIDRILRSKPFNGSERLRRFLAWTVDRVLRGEAESIKQFTIAREVFDRGVEFDPRIDSIVRTEAQRLRRKLDEYYLSDGAPDPVLISFASGSYVPVFTRRSGNAAGSNGRFPELVLAGTCQPAIAVLPFSNLSADPDQEYFCQGIAESIQERLSGSPSLKVISTSSAFRFGAGERDFARIGHDLNVTTIVEGSVQQLGARIRIHARGVDVASGSCIWAHVFDPEMQDVFTIQDEIAGAVAQTLTKQPDVDLIKAPSPPPDAYRLYLRGRYLWGRITAECCLEAMQCFERVISIAPGYAQAYAALADVYHWLYFLGVCSPAPLATLTRRLSLKALQLDRNCADAYISLAGATGVMQWQWQDAETLYRKGLELRPNNVSGYLQRGFCRLQQGDKQGSGADLEKASDLDPLSVRYHRAAGIYLYVLRDYEGAITVLERAVELGPEITNTQYYLGLVLLQVARFDDAIAALHRSLAPTATGAPMGVLVAAYAAMGRQREANETLLRLHDLSVKSFVHPGAFVHAYAGLGQHSKALDWLERAADERCTGLMLLNLDPLLDRLRDEPRFQTVLERMNLA